MTEYELQQLHLRAARGGSLSAGEQTALDAWYSELDKAESSIVNKVAASRLCSDLDARIEDAASQLVEASLRLQQTISQNAKLRKELEDLEIRLVKNFADSAA